MRRHPVSAPAPAGIHRGGEGQGPVPRRFVHLAVLATCVAVALRVAFFSISVSHVQPSADESIARLQAARILDGEFPLLFMAQPYLFPIESYLAAPFAPFLPWNAYGARFVPFALNILAVAVALSILFRVSDRATPWPGVLLILFPSSYYLMMQSAYALPGYTALSLLGGLTVLCALVQRESLYPVATAVLTGALAGLAFTSHMLALPFAAAVAAFMCLRSDWRAAARAGVSFGAGIAVGTVPYWLAKWGLPGAYGQVTQRHDWAAALDRLWSPAIKWTLSAALGTRTSLFPDEDALNHALLPATVTGAVWAAVLAGGLLLALVHLVRRGLRSRRVQLAPADLFIGIALMTLAAFVFSRRADSRSYRYFIPLVWSFPFLVNDLYCRGPRALRVPVGLLAVLLAGWNVASGIGLMQHWTRPGFAAEHASVAELRPVLAELRSRGIRHAVASYGTAYRITYMSGQQVLAAQPMNERFPGWPVPYKARVDAASRVAYVLTDTVRFLKPAVFERHLRTMGIDARKTTHGAYAVYTDFRSASNRPEPLPVPRELMQLSAGRNADALPKLTDGDPYNRWTTEALQKPGMWLRVDLARPFPLQAVRLHYGRYFHDHAPEMRMTLETESGDPVVRDGIVGRLDKFLFKNGRPVYGACSQTIDCPGEPVRAIVFEITRPNPRFAWTLCELEILADPNKADTP